MNKPKLPAMQSPCKDCPFRKDTLKGWLGAERMKEILAQTSFVCHKTTRGENEDRKQCAGHMIIKGNANIFHALAMSSKDVFEFDLSGRELVFETEQDCIIHHQNKRK